MYKQCKTEQSAARQRELMDGLLDAMIRQHYDEITVSSLCQQLQIPRKSFYRYFSSKEGALHSLIDHALMDAGSVSQENLKNALPSAQEELEQLFSFWLHRKKLLDALEKSGLSGVLINRAIRHMSNETMGQRRFLSREEQEAQRYITLFAVSGVLSMVIQWHHEGYHQTPCQMAEIAGRLLYQPVMTDLFL